MSKTTLPLSVGDISMFAKTIRRQLDGFESTPSHVEMLNLLTKAVGYRNFQHFRAQQEAQVAIDLPVQPKPEVDYKLVKKLLRLFNEGQLVRWPKKFSQRMICLWVMWSRIPARESMVEREVNELLDKNHEFGDYALLRRELVDRGLMLRTDDGRKYKRCEVQPPAEAVELFKRL
ncbi:DUF2087 domain-containing protein [Maridesulfovibrio frigidus]|uniref:DUF2087 domain-containing protein n=1 Tax=Maridesulfovibrio frigidus TaxID=340956 RepID=UPI0004E0B071|nr:DUF2087 domain-containing protein [Maridesulfovibrio frigidus]